MKGVVVGRGTYVSEYAHLGVLFTNDGFAECHAARLTALDSYPTGETVDVAFALTMMAGKLPQDIEAKGTSVEAYAEKHLEWLRILFFPQDTEEQRRARTEEAKVLGELGFRNNWAWCLMRAYCERWFYLTNTGYLGLGNHCIETGDVVAVLFGMREPCVLRPRGESPEDSYRFIG